MCTKVTSFLNIIGGIASIGGAYTPLTEIGYLKREGDLFIVVPLQTYHATLAIIMLITGVLALLGISYWIHRSLRGEDPNPLHSLGCFSLSFLTWSLFLLTEPLSFPFLLFFALMATIAVWFFISVLHSYWLFYHGD